MFSFIKIPFKDSKVTIARPFLCDKVKQLGICEGPCADRHNLCKTLDKECLNIPSKCFISIQLTKILSPSHFYGRILKYSTKKNPTKEQDWISVDDSFEILKYELENICSTPNNIVLCKTFIIGEMVMIQTEQNEFYRALVLDIINGWLTVNIKVILIDIGSIEEISSKKVFVLPSHLKELRPVAVEIIISSMEPAEEGSVFNWPVDTTNLVRSLLEPIILTGLEFICKVELTLGIILWVDWILAKKCIKCSHLACKLYKDSLILPKELIKRNLAKHSSCLIDKLINLDKDACLWDKQLNDLKPIIIKKSNIPLFSCKEQKKEETDEVIKVQWAHLSDNLISNVSVRYSDNPKCILICNKKFYENVIALQKDIDDAINTKTVQRLTCATVGNVCLALEPEENKYNRVLIKQIHNQRADVLYVDYGGFNNVQIQNLMTIPSSLIRKLPFQVIECSLSGFNNILQTDILDKFNNRLLELTDTRIHLKVISSSMDASLTDGTHYEVVLFNNDININVIMADEFNMHVDNTQIQNILSSNYKYTDYESEDDDEEDIQNYMDLLNSLLNQKNESDLEKSNQTNQTQIVPNSTNKKKFESDSNTLNQDRDANIEQEKYKKIKKKYCLDCNVTPVVPQCFWHQDDSSIYLKLNILGVNSYNTSYTMNTITVNIETNSVSYSLTVVLFAFIVEESCTCRVSFDGICIKAQKLIKVKYRWPRLLKCSKKHKYMIYDTEHVTERKNWNLWCKLFNKYKSMTLDEPINDNYPDSDYYDSDLDYDIFED